MPDAAIGHHVEPAPPIYRSTVFKQEFTTGTLTRHPVEQVPGLSDAFDVDVDAIAFVNRMEILGADSMGLRAVAQVL